MKKQTFIVTKGELIKRLPHLKAFYEIPDTIELQGVPVLKCTKVHNHKKSSVCVDNPKLQEVKEHICRWDCDCQVAKNKPQPIELVSLDSHMGIEIQAKFNEIIKHITNK